MDYKLRPQMDGFLYAIVLISSDPTSMIALKFKVKGKTVQYTAI